MRDDTCEHGVEGFCMKCCREGEGKPTGEPDLPSCHHCGGSGATKRVYLESGPLWFHQKCFERWSMYGAPRP